MVIGILILLVAYQFYTAKQAGKTLTAGELIKNAQDNYPVALQVKEVAEMAVGAAEEFARTGDIPDIPDEKLRTAISVFRKWIPYDLADDEAMIAAIKSFIPKINALTPERKKLP